MMKRIQPFFGFLIFGVILSILFSTGQIENPDTHLRLTQARIMVDECRFGLPADVGEEKHGNVAANENGRYMVYNPGQTLIFTPIYYLTRLISSNKVDQYYYSAFIVSFINYIIHAICTYFLFISVLALGSKRSTAIYISLLFGLTSYSFVFAQSTYEHHFEMLFVMASFYFSINDRSKFSGLIPGLILSFGMIFRTTAVIAFPMIFFIQNNPYKKLRAVLGLSIGIAFVLWYNYYRFGNPFESGYSLAWHTAHGQQFTFWSWENISLAVFGFLFSPGKGLLFFSPTILLSLWGLSSLWAKNRKLFYTILISSASYIGFFSLNFAWHGSIWSFGPRYILPIVPFLYLSLIYLNINKLLLRIALLAFILQISLLTVNYKRDVLSEYMGNNGVSDIEYIYDLRKTPYYSQAKQLILILPKNINRLTNYQPYSPWKKEIRTGSNFDVLNNSIEKNSLNFWWVRIFHWNFSIPFRLTSLLLVFASIIGLFHIWKYVTREIL